MKKRIFLKNSFYSVINYVLMVLLNLIIRKVLIIQFSIEYAGYEALFSDVFALLSVADLGMDNIITYHLYGSLTKKQEKMTAIMAQAKKMYSIISGIVLCVGIIYAFCIPFLFREEKFDRTLITIVFIIQMVNLCLTYLTGYKRLLLIADQKEYICLRWDTKILILVQLSRIFVLWYFRNYYLYMGLCIVQTLGQNIGINYKCNREYGKNIFKRQKVKLSGLRTDIKDFACHKISALVYSATDNIIITAILGLASAGAYSNYYMVHKYTYSLANKIMKPMQASIGHYLYTTEDTGEKYKLFCKLNQYAFFLGILICSGLIHLSTPFIVIWLGEEYIQAKSVVVLLALNYFIAINQDFVYFFRNSYGDYGYDKKYMMWSAGINIVMSILGCKIWGIKGVVLATIMGHIAIWYGRVKFVFSHVFLRSASSYWLKQIIGFLYLGIQVILTGWLLEDFRLDGLSGCVISGLVIFIISGIAMVIWYMGEKAFVKIKIFSNRR